MNSSSQDMLLDYYLLFAKLVQAVSTASKTLYDLIDAKENQQTVDNNAGVRDVLESMSIVPYVFKALTNFSSEEFEELCRVVCPIIATYARSTGELSKGPGRKPKLNEQQRLLNFLLYLKHDNTTIFDAHQWNWAKSSVCDDAIFIASCIDHACSDEIRWPTAHERVQLAKQISEFPGCIGFIDGTLCKIQRPSGPDHRKYYNGRKSIYCLNNVVIIDHQGLFIYVDPGYPGSYHDVNCLRNSDISIHWQQYFTITENYQEFLLSDPGYMGEDVFIMRRVDRREIPDDADEHELSAIDAYEINTYLRINV
jgi:hypothetical protein